MELQQTHEYQWTIPAHGRMRVPGIVFTSRSLLPAAQEDRSLSQVENVATLPGIAKASYAMPDIHWGYGFPIGGVAATDVERDGVVSPGGVGFDISCGVRLLRTSVDQLPRPVETIMRKLEEKVPAGMGRGAIWKLDSSSLNDVLARGAAAAVDAGLGTQADLVHAEDGGGVAISDVGAVSKRALERGLNQLGSLGSGNHFLEVQRVARILDARVATAFGLAEGMITVMIHTGSRGLGHQVCSDALSEMQSAMDRYGIEVPDRQLACVPVRSEEGRAYLNMMSAAANYGRANRQAITAAVRDALADLGPIEVVYDVSHNLAKIEEHAVDGRRRKLCVHRKGATRALPPNHPELPFSYRHIGQPVLIPGSMGTASYVLVGKAGNQAFNSTCHGAGRAMSRHAALKLRSGQTVRDQLRQQGIIAVAKAVRALGEEAPEAYKNIDEIVRTCEGAGLSRVVARLEPVGVLKG